MASMSLTAFAQKQYSSVSIVSVSLKYASEKAYCTAKIVGIAETKSFTDCTLILTDSAGNIVESWAIDYQSGSSLSISKISNTVKQGKTYTLTFTATVHSGNSSEIVTESTTKKYE